MARSRSPEDELPQDAVAVRPNMTGKVLIGTFKINKNDILRYNVTKRVPIHTIKNGNVTCTCNIIFDSNVSDSNWR